MNRVTWLERLEVDGKLAYRLGRTSAGFVMEWPSIGHYDTAARRFEATPGGDPRLASKLERGIVRALDRYLEGKITLHAGAATRDGVALAVVGESGSGKSTATAMLCERRGFAMLADDVVAVDATEGGPMVLPTESDHWLRGEACGWFGLPADSPRASFSAARIGCPSRLESIVQLRGDRGPEKPTLRRLRGHAAMVAVAQATFRLRLDRSSAEDLDRIQELCQSVPVWELARSAETPLDAVADLLSWLMEMR